MTRPKTGYCQLAEAKKKLRPLPSQWTYGDRDVCARPRASPQRYPAMRTRTGLRVSHYVYVYPNIYLDACATPPYGHGLISDRLLIN